MQRCGLTYKSLLFYAERFLVELQAKNLGQQAAVRPRRKANSVSRPVTAATTGRPVLAATTGRPVPAATAGAPKTTIGAAKPPPMALMQQLKTAARDRSPAARDRSPAAQGCSPAACNYTAFDTSSRCSRWGGFRVECPPPILSSTRW